MPFGDLLGSMKLGSRLGFEHRVAHRLLGIRELHLCTPPPAGLLVADESEHQPSVPFWSSNSELEPQSDEGLRVGEVMGSFVHVMGPREFQ